MKSVITTIALLFVSLICFGQNSEYAKLDNYLMTLEQNDRFHGSVAVSRAGEVIYSKAIGYADIENEIANTTETKFRIGSISKTFTAVLIMKAVEMGKISLDDNIDAYFPRILNADKISIRHLLNQRSGIVTFTDRDYLSWYTKPIKQSKLLDIIVSKGIDFEPDAKYAYSNSNYVLLTFILESAFKKSYAQVLDKYIVKPLKLSSTSYGSAINPTKNEALSYRKSTEWDKEPETDMSIPLGAGGIVSTPTDLCFFMEALFDGKLISTESLKQMKPITDDSYGFALEYQAMDDKNGIGHMGDIDAFTSTLAYFEESDLCFALSCNGANYGKHDIAIAVISEMFGKAYELPTFEFVELASEDLDQYLGIYESDDLPLDLTFSKEGNTLIAKGTGQAAFSLMAEGDHKFSAMELGLKVTFMPEDKKLSFSQGGMSFEMTLKESSEPSESVEPIELSSEDLNQYLGTYVSDDLPIDLTVSQKDNTLICQGTGQPSFSLTPEGDHQFSYKEIGLKITFIPTEKKLTFSQSGASFEMILEE